jgi:GxxExxY protein
MKPNELTHAIIGASIEVHRELGPGKPEIAYEGALSQELTLRGIAHQAQKPVPVIYKGIKLECGYRLDVLVANSVVVEAKAVEVVIPVHRAQVLTYMKIGGWKVALLLNFNVATLKEGIERFVLGVLREGDEPMTPSDNRVPQALPDESRPFLYADSNTGDPEAERLAREVIAAAVEVHTQLGPGLLPSTYEVCLSHEFLLRGVPFEYRRPLPLTYKGAALAAVDEVRILVGGRVVVFPRAVTSLQPVHGAELLSQLRLGGWRLGLLLNFNTVKLKEGIRRMVFNSQNVMA